MLVAARYGQIRTLAGSRCETKVGRRQAVLRDRVLDLGDDPYDLHLAQCIGLRLQHSDLRTQYGKGRSARLGCHVPAFRVGANASEDRSDARARRRLSRRLACSAGGSVP